MPDKSGNTLSEWAEAIRTQLHRQDIRLTKMETIMKVIYVFIILLIAAGGVIVALLAHLKSVT